MTFLASPLVKLAIVAGLLLGAYAYGRVDGNRLCEARYAEAALEAEKASREMQARLSDANIRRVEAETAARAQRLSAARSTAPSCDVPPGAVETMRGLMGE